jgi:predicted ATP-grasp superfamily ATP-dependent carboligase
MLQELGFSGFSCIEFKRDARDGVYKILDVNGRHNLSTLLAVHCGINFPWLHYLHLTEGIAPQESGYREEIYWIDLVRDIGYTGIYLTREKCSMMDFVHPYLRSHVFAIFDRTDLGPFLRRVISYKARKKL